MGPREQIVEAYLAGRKAGRAADPPRCPYPVGDLRRRAWFMAYGRARPVNDDQGDE